MGRASMMRQDMTMQRTQTMRGTLTGTLLAMPKGLHHLTASRGFWHLLGVRKRKMTLRPSVWGTVSRLVGETGTEMIFKRAMIRMWFASEVMMTASFRRTKVTQLDCGPSRSKRLSRTKSWASSRWMMSKLGCLTSRNPHKARITRKVWWCSLSRSAISPPRLCWIQVKWTSKRAVYQLLVGKSASRWPLMWFNLPRIRHALTPAQVSTVILWRLPRLELPQEAGLGGKGHLLRNGMDCLWMARSKIRIPPKRSQMPLELTMSRTRH